MYRNLFAGTATRVAAVLAYLASGIPPFATNAAELVVITVNEVLRDTSLLESGCG